MIPEQHRLFPHWGRLPPDGIIEEAIWAVSDWDSRRWITAEGPSDVFGDDEAEAICRVLLLVIDDLEPDITKVTFPAAGEVMFVDPSTDKLVVIDFGLAAYIGSEHEYRHRNDVNGVIYTLYEILTHDNHFRDCVHPDNYHIEDVTSMEEWPLQIDLEPGLDVQTLRSMVMKWAEIRHQNGPRRDLIHNTFTIPKMPEPRWSKMTTDEEVPLVVEESSIFQSISTGEKGVRWERTPKSKLCNQKQGGQGWAR